MERATDLFLQEAGVFKIENNPVQRAIGTVTSLTYKNNFVRGTAISNEHGCIWFDNYSLAKEDTKLAIVNVYGVEPKKIRVGDALFGYFTVFNGKKIFYQAWQSNTLFNLTEALLRQQQSKVHKSCVIPYLLLNKRYQSLLNISSSTRVPILQTAFEFSMQLKQPLVFILLFNVFRRNMHRLNIHDKKLTQSCISSNITNHLLSEYQQTVS